MRMIGFMIRKPMLCGPILFGPMKPGLTGLDFGGSGSSVDLDGVWAGPPDLRAPGPCKVLILGVLDRVWTWIGPPDLGGLRTWAASGPGRPPDLGGLGLGLW